MHFFSTCTYSVIIRTAIDANFNSTVLFKETKIDDEHAKKVAYKNHSLVPRDLILEEKIPNYFSNFF